METHELGCRWWPSHGDTGNRGPVPAAPRSPLCHRFSASGCAWLAHSVVPNSLWPRGLQAPLSKGSPRQEYWSGLPFPAEDLPQPGIKPTFPASPALAGGFFTAEPPGKRTSRPQASGNKAAFTVAPSAPEVDGLRGQGGWALPYSPQEGSAHDP